MSHASSHAASAATATAGSGASPAVPAALLLPLVLLGTRFVQGFIFWGGASRRLFYDFQETAGVDLAVKLDFDAPGFVAAKLVHALPGALIQGPVEWTLAHPALIDISVWLWTFAELAVGLGLIFGLFTRLAALGSLAINVVLMAVFGWMGSTCLDEWTMAVSGVAMSSAVFIAGGGGWSLDALAGRTAVFARNPWTRWIFSGPLSAGSIRALGLLFAAVAVVFTVGSYQMLFGAVISPLHSRVNFHHHAIALSDVAVAPDGAVRFSAYVDAGPDTGAAYVVAARLVDASGTPVASWDGAALKQAAIENAWPYAWASKFKAETIGFSGATGARATIDLPAAEGAQVPAGTALTLVLEAIDGSTWEQAAKHE
ncbi:MAG: DoxX family membrane protein [Bauldia sp.]|nr:DoxX family membrane protein [Bauldia sp.]